MVGLARGGVVVAAEVARVLGAALDVVAVRKVGHPFEPEYALGAVAPGIEPYIRSPDGIGDARLEWALSEAQVRAAQLDSVLHGGRPPLFLAGRAVVLVDDGLATGATMIAAARWARSRGAARVVCATPVAAADSLAAIAGEADEIVCLHERDDFGAVGFWYRDFPEVSDETVCRLLSAGRETYRGPLACSQCGRSVPTDPDELAGWAGAALVTSGELDEVCAPILLCPECMKELVSDAIDEGTGD